MRRYYGHAMNVYEVLPGYRRLARLTDLSQDAGRRLKWFDYYYAHGENARLTCRHFDISPQTFYRWKKRYSGTHVESLETRSHRPRHMRQPEYSPQLVEAVRVLREQYPRWGKDKLVVLLCNEGFSTSTSTVGRILRRLKERGLLHETVGNGISARRRQKQRPYAVRKPKEYVAEAPGDIVEVDTLDVRPLPGVTLKHFTARDVVSRWDVLEVHTHATSRTASAFMDALLERMPFPVKAIQVDGGSEFEDLFEAECQKRGIRLFVLPPRSPKLNGHVERAQRTHTEEFYELTDCDFDLVALNKALRRWELIYDTVRPHQALGYLTPHQFLQQYHHNRKEVMCH